MNRFLKNDQELQAQKVIADIYEKILPKLEKTEKDLEKFLKKITRKEKLQHPKVLTRIKTIDSIVDKVVNRGKNLSEMGDMVASAILTKEQDAPAKIYKRLKRKYSSSVVDAEKKEKGGDPQYGYYGSYHLDLRINGIVTEIQIMTQKLWNYKSAAHDIYTATRAKKEVDKFSKNLSKKLFSMGNQPGYVRETIEMYGIDDIELLESVFNEYYITD